MIRAINNQKGTIMIFVMIWVPILVAALALLTDAGKILVIKHELQSAVDAASLAGASQFSEKYMEDSNGIPIVSEDSEVITIDPVLAKNEADKVFYDNTSLKDFNTLGVTITNVEGKVTTSRWGNPEYSYKASVCIDLFFMSKKYTAAISRADISK